MVNVFMTKKKDDNNTYVQENNMNYSTGFIPTETVISISNETI